MHPLHPTRGAITRGLLAGVALAGLLLLVSWNTEAHFQQSPETDAFLNAVDADGDGVHTPGDRAVMEWWLEHGGSAATAQSNAVDSAGVLNVRAFLDSPAAQLNP